MDSLTLMDSYTTANGRGSVNWDPLTMRALRRDFDGVVVTDFDEVFNSVYFHHHSINLHESVVHFLNSEVDIFMVPSDPGGFISSGVKAVSSGRVSRSLLETKVRRVWKFKESMYGVSEDFDLEGFREEDKRRSTEAARESIVLLKNERNVLPVKQDAKVSWTRREETAKSHLANHLTNTASSI